MQNNRRFQYLSGDDMEHIGWRDKRNIKKLNELLKANAERDDIFASFIKSFVYGESIYGESPLRRRYFWKMPKRTNDFKKNYDSITKWLNEYAEVQTNREMQVALNHELKSNEMENFKYACTAGRTIEDQIHFLTNVRRVKEVTKYDIYQDYLNAVVMHENRKKPWFWQKEAKAQYQAEANAIKDFEEYMVSMGISRRCIKNARKNKRLDDLKVFEQSLVTNAHDRLEQFKQAYKNMEILNAEVKKQQASRESKAFALCHASVNYYLGCIEMHRAEANKVRNAYEQSAYEEEERLINQYKDTMLNKYRINEEYLESVIENSRNDRFSGRSSMAPHCTLVPSMYSTYTTNTVEELNLMNNLLTNLKTCPRGYEDDESVSYDEKEFDDSQVYESDEDIEREVNSINIRVNIEESLNNERDLDQSVSDDGSSRDDLDDLIL